MTKYINLAIAIAVSFFLISQKTYAKGPCSPVNGKVVDSDGNVYDSKAGYSFNRSMCDAHEREKATKDKCGSNGSTIINGEVHCDYDQVSDNEVVQKVYEFCLDSSKSDKKYDYCMNKFVNADPKVAEDFYKRNICSFEPDGEECNLEYQKYVEELKNKKGPKSDDE